MGDGGEGVRGVAALRGDARGSSLVRMGNPRGE